MAEAIPGIIGFLGTQKSASKATIQAGEEQGRETFRTQEAVRQRRIETQNLLGQQAAGFASSGVSFSGSPLEIFKETAQRGLEDEVFIKSGGDSSILKRAEKRARATRTKSIGTLITGTNTALKARK